MWQDDFTGMYCWNEAAGPWRHPNSGCQTWHEGKRCSRQASGLYATGTEFYNYNYIAVSPWPEMLMNEKCFLTCRKLLYTENLPFKRQCNTLEEYMEWACHLLMKGWFSWWNSLTFPHFIVRSERSGESPLLLYFPTCNYCPFSVSLSIFQSSKNGSFSVHYGTFCWRFIFYGGNDPFKKWK